MKFALSTLLVPLAALALTFGEALHMARFSSDATVIQHAGATPTPTPKPPGPILPGDSGGAHRTSAQAEAVPSEAVPAANEMQAAPDTPASSERLMELEGNFGRVLTPAMRAPRRSRVRSSRPFRTLQTLEAMESGFPTPCDPAEQASDGLSGDYLGNIAFDEFELHGDARLIICGNKFTLYGPGIASSGVVTSIKTPGYTAAAFRFVEVTGFDAPTLSLPKTVSVRVSRSGKTTSFRSAPKEPSKFAFIWSSQKRGRP